MHILVGLGNPGRKYSDTKHNFGFWAIDRFTEKKSLTFQAGKGDYLLAKKGKLVCIKPTTFMNTSGTALLDVKQFFKAEPENFLVVYDDIDYRLEYYDLDKAVELVGIKDSNPLSINCSQKILTVCG